MLINREYQNELLSFLLNEYPTYEHAREHCQKLLKDDEEKYLANVDYLQRHNLIEDGVSIRFSLDGHTMINIMPFPKITEIGIDFMLSDGGLSAVLNVQTIKIHPETIKALIESKIQNASIDDREKSTLIDRIRSLPEEGAKRLLDKLLDNGIELLLRGGLNLLDVL